MRACLCVLLAALAVTVGPTGALHEASAQSATKACIKDACKTPKKQCQIAFQAQFKIAKLDCDRTCTDNPCRKDCKRTAKQTFKAAKSQCKAMFSGCKSCCKDAGTSATCPMPVCGDGLVAGDEQCDQGAQNSDDAPDTCRTGCTLFGCGDGVVDYREECDGDDTPCSGRSCQVDCTCEPSTCGDDALDPGEDCDGSDDDLCPGLCGPQCECLDRLAFTTGTPGGACGRINDANDCNGTDLTPFGGSGPVLDCGTLYIGGGASVQPPSPTPDGATSIFLMTNTSDPSAVVLAAATSTDTQSIETCTDAGCFFGPPLPIPNTGAPAVSTCVINRIAASPAVGGKVDITTGDAEVTLPLTVTVYVTGDIDPDMAGIQPCAPCVDGFCSVGANAGGSCSTPTTLLTSHDCPPPVEKTPLAPFAVDLSPLLTANVTSIAFGGDFCGATTGQRDVGAFGQPTAQCIAVVGATAGDLRGGAAHDAVQASVFCIPASGDPLVDAVANLPGPGAVTLTGELQLVP